MNFTDMHIQADTYTLRPTFFYTFISELGSLFLMGLSFFVLHFFKVPELYINIAMLLLFIRLVYRFLLAQSYSYTFEADQIIIKYGVFNIYTQYIELFRVKDFNMYRSLLMRCIGVMRINIYTSDVTQKILQIHGVPKSDFVLELRRLVMQSRRNNGVFEVD